MLIFAFDIYHWILPKVGEPLLHALFHSYIQLLPEPHRMALSVHFVIASDRHGGRQVVCNSVDIRRLSDSDFSCCFDVTTSN